MQLLLFGDSGRPFLEHCKPAILERLGEARRVAFVTAANLYDERAYFERARAALAPLDVVHFRWNADPLATLERADSIFMGGGNTYALLGRLRQAALLGPIRDRVRAGLPYFGASAGANVAGPTILTTNDWNVVGLGSFDALGLVPFNVNPHFREADQATAPFSETRAERIAEYHCVWDNPVVGIEESTWLRVDDDVATVAGAGRARLFVRRQPPRWFRAGERLDLPRAPSA